MRKIKLTVQCRVPSWGYCNHDVYTDNLRYSKELCRFCVKSKTGYHCALHDAPLAADSNFVHKTRACVDATAGFAITADEPVPHGPTIHPKKLLLDAFSKYNKTVEDLVRQGYPRSIAEKTAQMFIVDDCN